VLLSEPQILRPDPLQENASALQGMKKRGQSNWIITLITATTTEALTENGLDLNPGIIKRAIDPVN